MAYNPGVSFFIPFHELDPSKQNQCICFTQKGARCRRFCGQSDNSRAVTLHKTMIASASELVSLDLLQEYVLCNCCRSGRAGHRNRIEDFGLLIPLARRWQDEIWRRAADQSNYITSSLPLEDSISILYAYTTRVTSTPSHTTTLHTLTASPSYRQSNPRTSYSINLPPSKSAVSSSSYEYGFPRSSATAEFTSQPFRSQPRYNLRPREANIPTDPISTRPPSISQATLSEFLPHKAVPRPSDSVSRKISESLRKKDFDTGSLYIFNRASSPGHVKIGWTTGSVSSRLKTWSKCGYNPNLLFSVGRVPHARRVETLTHHELIKEWRRERMCEAEWCRKSHKEWFEISRERAEQVLVDWANFIKKAEPYDSAGSLKNQWKEIIKMMDGNRELVTGKKLLEYYETSLVEEATLVGELVDLGHVTKIEEGMSIGYGLEVERLEASKEALVSVGSLWIERPTLPKEALLFKSEAWSKQILLAEISLPKAEKQPKSDPLFKRKPLPKTEALPRTQFPFSAEPSLKTAPPFKAEALSKTESLPTSGPTREEVLAPERTPVKKEQITLSSSPLLQSTNCYANTIPSHDMNLSPGTGTEKASAIHIVTNPETDITVVDTSSNLKVSSSVSPSAPVSISAKTSPSAAPGEGILQMNTHASTDNTSTKCPSLNFPDPFPEPIPSNSSATSASPRPKVEPVSYPPAPLVTEISEPLPSLSSDCHEGVVETLTQITQHQQIVEGGGQAEPESEILSCDGLTCEIESHSWGESTATTNEAGAGGDAWDEEETLVEDETPRFWEKAALKIVDGLYNEISTGEADGVLKGLDGPEILEGKAPLVIEVVSQT